MPAIDPCAIVELRQYTLRPGKRDTLIELFDREFLESQEALGMTIVGQFRDLDDPDRFVWLRGFADMDTRLAGLQGFYGGPAWKPHSAAANATMIDSDNVLLLRPAFPGSGFGALAERSPHVAGASAGDATRHVYVANALYFREPVEASFVSPFRERIAPEVQRNGGRIVGAFVTERSANTFPALPVRESESAFVWIARFRAIDDYERFVGALDASPARQLLTDGLNTQLLRPVEVHRLVPTLRSRLG